MFLDLPARCLKLFALCRRCQELSNGSMVQGVADLWGRDGDNEERRLVSPEQLRTQLAQVQLPSSPTQSANMYTPVRPCPASASECRALRDL